jgi:hypothetical protein
LQKQRSAATIGNDYKTDASSLRRRQSNASTIYSHYDRSKVPLSISQQTSNSAMAKGLPSKANSLLDMDGTLAGPAHRKKKPSRLDLSMLKPRSRKDTNLQVDPVLCNSYVTRSPSFMSQISSPRVTPGKLRKSPSAASTSTYKSPAGMQDSMTLSQLYDHYERMSFRSEPSPIEEISDYPHFDSVPEEPTPPLTTCSTLSLVTPLSNPVIREPNHRLGHLRKDSVGSRNTVTSSSSRSLATSHHVSPARDYASSISSRNTSNTRISKISKISRTLDSDLQTNSVLSLSDSDSDDGTFSDSAPKSSMSSHTNISHEDISVLGDRNVNLPRPPIIHERTSSRQKHQNFAPLNDYLAVPSSAGKGHSARQPSNSTLRSFVSSTSTATATRNAAHESGRASRLSASTSETLGSQNSLSSHKKPEVVGRGAQEATLVTLKPLASTAEALDSLRELTAQATAKHRRTLSSDQLTPPLSPSSIASYDSSPGKASAKDEPVDAHNARLMAVTKQEEMLLAALRQKRAMMRENMLTETEESQSSVTGRRRSSASSCARDSQTTWRTSKTTSFQNSSGAPQLPPFQPRNSSLVSSFKNLTERKDIVRRTDSNVRFADDPDSAVGEDLKETRFSPVINNAHVKDDQVGRHERVLMFLDRPLYDIDAIDAAEPSPDLSEFMDYDQDSDGEIVPERRRSRRGSRFSSTYISSSPAVRRGDRPRADSNLLGVRGSSLRRQLENLPETCMESYDEDDIDFDGFSDVMNPPRSETSACDPPREHDIARPSSPVSQPAEKHQVKGHVKGKNSAVRLSAVGNVGLFLPPEVGLWGDDG